MCIRASILLNAILLIGMFVPDLFAFEFAKDGKAACVIAVSRTPNKMERWAAWDLEKFLEKATGADFKVVPEHLVKGRSALYLGQTDFAADNGIDFLKLYQEEWIIRNVGKNLIITGGRRAGTFYGVWALFRQIGIWPVFFRQYVFPEKMITSIPVRDEQKKPSFLGRDIQMLVLGPACGGKMPEASVHEFNLWCLRIGHDAHKTYRSPSLYYGPQNNLGTPNCHTLGLFVEPDKYFATHPEYFAMDAKGKRYKPKTPYLQGGLCLSNADVKRISLESLRKMIKKNRAANPKDEWARIYDISVLDNTPFICKCPECAKITREEGNSECGLLLRYINYIADGIAKEYPDVVIRTITYSAARLHPKITKPVKNVQLRLVDEFPESHAFRPLSDEMNAFRRKYLEKWLAFGTQFSLWDYGNMGWDVYFNPPRVETLIDTLKPDMLYFRNKLSVIALLHENECCVYSPQNFINLNYFLQLELMMDLEQDPEKLISIFMKGYFGPAAPAMTEILNDLRKKCLESPEKRVVLRGPNWDFYTPEYAVKLYLKLKKIEESLPAGSEYRERVQFERITPIWSCLVDRMRFESAFRKANINMDDLYSECRKLVEKYQHRWGQSEPGETSALFEKVFRSIPPKVPCPRQFKKLPPDDIRIFPSQYAQQDQNGSESKVVNDPDSPTGRALKVTPEDSKLYGINKRIWITDKFAVPSTRFNLGNSGPGPKGDSFIVLKKVPQDEKYHLYKLGNPLELGPGNYVWGLAWKLRFKTKSIYVSNPENTGTNIWQGWISLKFTGPAYVNGSKKENAVYSDMVVFTKPETSK